MPGFIKKDSFNNLEEISKGVLNALLSDEADALDNFIGDTAMPFSQPERDALQEVAKAIFEHEESIDELFYSGKEPQGFYEGLYQTFFFDEK